MSFSYRFLKPTVRVAMKAAVILLITFFLLESALFLFDDVIFHGSFNMFDPDMGFRVRPYAQYGAATANEFGFNDRDYPHERKAGTYRILFLSDSFNWMGGPECNYTAILERKFAEKFGEGRVEVISAGYSGTHTAEQLALLRKFGLLYQPDLVVLGVYTGNDFFDAHPYRKRIALGGTTADVYTDRDFYAVLWGRPLVVRSRFLLLLREKWLLRRHSELLAPLRRTQPVQATSAEEAAPAEPLQALTAPELREAKTIESAEPVYTDAYLKDVLTRMEFVYRNRSPIFDSFERYILDSLLAMRDLLAEKGVAFMVAAFPDEVHVSPALRRALEEHFRADPHDYDWTRARDLLQEFSEGEGIEFHDLLPAFEAEALRGERLYLESNAHWNDAGNQLAADLFFDLLQQKVSQGDFPLH